MNRIFATTYSEIIELFKTHKRIAITGYPGAGKTLLSTMVRSRAVIHTDHYLKLPRDKIATQIMTDLSTKGKYVVEGTQIPKMLSQGFQPDVVIWLIGGTRPNCQGIRTQMQTYMAEYKGNVTKINLRDAQDNPFVKRL